MIDQRIEIADDEMTDRLMRLADSVIESVSQEFEHQVRLGFDRERYFAMATEVIGQVLQWALDEPNMHLIRDASSVMAIQIPEETDA